MTIEERLQRLEIKVFPHEVHTVYSFHARCINEGCYNFGTPINYFRTSHNPRDIRCGFCEDHLRITNITEEDILIEC